MWIHVIYYLFKVSKAPDRQIENHDLLSRVYAKKRIFQQRQRLEAAYDWFLMFWDKRSRILRGEKVIFSRLLRDSSGPSVRPTIYPSIRLSVCLSIHLSIQPLLHTSIPPSVHLSVRPLSIAQSVIHIHFLVACYATLHPALSVSRLVGWSVTLYFFNDFIFSTSLFLPKRSVDLKYGPCPPARDFGSRVSGLVEE